MAKKKRKQKTRIKKIRVKIGRNKFKEVVLKLPLPKRKPIVLVPFDEQTGSRVSLSFDRKKKAAKPGIRLSSNLKVYRETRRNRSDLKKHI